VIVAVAFFPVLLMLALLLLMDSFKLVPIRSVILVIIAGAVIAGICLPFHDWLIGRTMMDMTTFTRYIAPATEETLKAATVVLLLQRRRIGFLVDAAVYGFAVGAGFALVENADYLWHLERATLALWLVRGLGTAVLHGTTTAVFAMVTKTLLDRHGNRLIIGWWPGLLAAFFIHSIFNHLLLPPLMMTALLMLVLPIVMVIVFQQSEHATREWVGAGLDLDVQLLDLIRSEHFAATKFGNYLQQVRDRFGGMVAADMFCLLRVELELSVQAKAMLLAREAGLVVPVTADLQAALRELSYLQRSIGRMGLLALKPLQVTTDRDHWHRYLLTAAAKQ
jgi:protease PrsW